ncbi:atg c terminal domain-containing protein [Ophiostoma piceae UAMH 11346]|uniref:Autophagy-related protein 2 n=1 Tax=Ophiostoma piceae (strain UAMH 11346) TaxID=1262450 RepID=S3CXP9_OPHP1|nr:atg c terminal domain-containing protein [Ophiostoma piceae UAMH 11346]
MASLLDSFRSSSMPKRLLRYALSRFDVLDADALNLDNLDLAWGRNTVLEFRDVGLKLNILQQLLQLPPTFHIRKAKVALLRVTLPVDIYSSPIQIQVTGVDVRLRISKDDESSAGSSKRRGSKSPTDDEDAVPTAVDLAQSFLEHQPSDEKRALEEALAAAEEDDDYYEDDDSTASSSQVLGTGQALTLPAFLAGFLQGIVDRIQVNIEGVTFQLEVDVPVDTVASSPTTAPSAAASSNAVESVTFQLALSRINVEGVTATIPAPQQPDEAGQPPKDGETGRPPIVPKEGKRHISLENVRAFLISEANVFSTLARSPSMPSSLASRSPSIPSQAPSSHASAAASPKQSFPYHDLAQSNPFSDSHELDELDDMDSEGGASIAASSVASASMMQSHYGLQDSEEAFNIPYEMGSSSEDNDSVNNEPQFYHEEVDEAMPPPPALASSSSTPRASVYGDMAGLTPSLSTALPSYAAFNADHLAAQSAIVRGNDEKESPQWNSWEQEARSEPSLPKADASTSRHTVQNTAEDAGLGLGLGLVLSDAPLASSTHSDSVASSGGRSDELAESHIYSHEEAESMYMSAFSQAQSVRLRNAMPGGWDDDDEDDNYAQHSSHHAREESPSDMAVFGRASSSTHPGMSSQLPLRPAAAESSTTSQSSSTPAAAGVHAGPAVPHNEAFDEPDNEELESSSYTAGSASPRLRGGGLSDSETLDDSKSQPDDTATPRGPARLVKEILALDYISIYVPSNHKQIDIAQQSIPSQHRHSRHNENLGRSVMPHLPGAFSVYSSAGAASTVGDASFHTSIDESQLLQPDVHAQPGADDSSIEISLAPLEVRFDTSIGFLLAMVVTELVQSLKLGLEQKKQKEQQKQQRRRGPNASSVSQNAAASAIPDIKFRAEKISLLFLDKLAGVADTAERFFGSPQASSYNQQGDVLLQAIFEDLVVAISPPADPSPVSITAASTTMPRRAAATPLTKTKIDLRRFRFGYSDADIVSFDRRIQMRASVRDVFPPAGDDISIKVAQSSDALRCEINTLPLLVSIDLQRLDETFSWFGGLSSFLSMGSSITSAASQGVGSPTKAEAPKVQKARGVRFEAPINPDDKSIASENKVDMRIGGVHLDLVGRDCSVSLDTSAVKLVHREEGVGIGVSRVRLAGPCLRNSRGDPPVAVEISNTRLEFLNVPKDKDLERLLELITPSRVQFDDRDDVIMLDTLLKQRRSGSLLRLNVDDLNVHAQNLGQLACLPSFSEEIARLATVAKYLPEDDRPGLLTLGLIRRIEVTVDIDGRLGQVQASVGDLEMAHITMPSLVSVALGSIAVHRNHDEELIGSSFVPAGSVNTPTGTTPPSASSGAAPASGSPAPMQSSGQSPALMLRIIGNDMEPMIKIKMWGLNFEYRVPTIMDVLGLAEDITPQDFEASLAASVANLGEQAHSAIASSSAAAAKTKKKAQEDGAKPMVVDLSFRDCVVGLNPLGLSSKLNIVLVDTHLEMAVPQVDERIFTVIELNRLALLLVDDVSNLASAKEVTFAPGHAARRSSGDTSYLSPPQSLSKDMVSRLSSRGFVEICQISAAKVIVDVSAPDEDGQKTIDLEVRDDLLVLETCADSTQTLITLANALKPPTPPSKEVKFKTEVMPVKDLLASISIDAFGRAEGNYNFDEDFILEEDDYAEGTAGDYSEGDLYGASPEQSQLLYAGHRSRAMEHSVASLPSALADDDDILFDGDLDDLDVGHGRHGGHEEHGEHGEPGTVAEQLFNASSVFSERTERPPSLSQSYADLASESLEPIQLGYAHNDPIISSVEEIKIIENFWGNAEDSVSDESTHANRWSSVQNNYDNNRSSGGVGLSSKKRPPLRVRVRDVHVIWNLFDGYDWQHTRDVITKTVEEVEAKAFERRQRNRRSGNDQYNPYSDEEEEEAVIGDFLFNSIYIGIPANHDPRELAQAINQNIYGDAGGDTESIAATTVTATSSRFGGAGGRRGHSKKLKLNRSRRHKITFELGGVAADLVAYPPGSGETQSSIDVRIRDLDVFDHVPTSTWKKFATYDRDAGERPIDGDMVHLEVLIVKPVPELAATEFVLKVSLLPLRLHVDQDALDFITRFFEFKDETAPPTHASESDIPFIQRAEIRDIPVQLDFKPKRVDYAGLRSGHTTEFMNFLILDGSRMTMRHTIIYGVSGFDRLGKTLNDIWMPDIQRYQLPGVLAGIAPVRSLVNVSSGFRDLIEIPIQEYRHNGRIVRSISKGAMAFAKSTGTELVKLGAKVATGTQYVLQGAEDILNKNNPDAQAGGFGSGAGASGAGDMTGDDSDDERKQISLYADQPTGVVQGLRHAYTSLARDLHVARDAIIAVPAEVRESTSATGAAKVVIKHAPTIIFRPAIGASKAIGQTLMGATNSLDPQNLRRIEDKYKSGPGRRG